MLILCSVKTKQIFISHSELAGWSCTKPSCNLEINTSRLIREIMIGHGPEKYYFEPMKYNYKNLQLLHWNLKKKMGSTKIEKWSSFPALSHRCSQENCIGCFMFPRYPHCPLWEYAVNNLQFSWLRILGEGKWWHFLAFPLKSWNVPRFLGKFHDFPTIMPRKVPPSNCRHRILCGMAQKSSLFSN